MTMRFLTAVLRTIRNSRRLATGLIILGLMVLLALMSPLIAKAVGGGQDPIELAAYDKWLVPSAQHLLGTDQFGRDVFAMVVKALAVSLQIGAIAGWRRGKLGSRIATNLSIALSHVPYFFVALILVYIFAYTLGMLPARSAYDSNIDPGITPQFIGSVLKYGLLPGLSIVLIGTFSWILSTRMLMIPVLGEDYLVYAEAKGLKGSRILTRYALRNCYLPQITAFGISLGFIFNGNVLVEQLFNYPGLGTTLVTAIQQLDFNTILGVTNIAIFSVLTAVLILDLLLPLLDPRVKYWK